MKNTLSVCIHFSPSCVAKPIASVLFTWGATLWAGLRVTELYNPAMTEKRRGHIQSENSVHHFAAVNKCFLKKRHRQEQWVNKTNGFVSLRLRQYSMPMCNFRLIGLPTEDKEVCMCLRCSYPRVSTNFFFPTFLFLSNLLSLSTFNTNCLCVPECYLTAS